MTILMILWRHTLEINGGIMVSEERMHCKHKVFNELTLQMFCLNYWNFINDDSGLDCDNCNDYELKVVWIDDENRE